MTVDAHDQTRGDSIPFFSDAQPAPLSCNEAAALCMKAARGAGMGWGMAEEAGFAAAWLVSHGIDGPSHLRAHLDRVDGWDWADLCPLVQSGVWGNAKGLATCPVILGATLCDYAALPEGPVPQSGLTLGQVSAPMLLVPFLSEIARMKGLSFALSWVGGEIVIGGHDNWPQASLDALGAPQLALTLFAKDASRHRPSAASISKAKTTAATVAALNVLAMRTTVPASAASRAGAGSTLSDNE